VRHLEMLFNVCGSQGPEILCGNWKAVLQQQVEMITKLCLMSHEILPSIIVRESNLNECNWNKSL
jgi:hypothetical protein